MRTVVFVVSHLGSESHELVRILNNNPRVQISNTENEHYNHPLDLRNLLEKKHKLDNAAAVYGDHLLFNYCLSSKAIYSICKFIYLIRPAKSTLNIIRRLYPNYTNLTAYRYYCFRLRRIFEMAKKTPGSVLITWSDLANDKGYSLIEKYLNLKEPLVHSNEGFLETDEDEIPAEYVDLAQSSYERYLYSLKQIDLSCE